MVYALKRTRGIKVKNVDMLVRFITKSLGVPVLVWKGHGDELKEFEKRHCLFPGCQPQVTAENLEFFFGTMKTKTVYEWEVPLKLHLLMFLFGDMPVLIGPFADTAWDDMLFSCLLSEQGIPADQFPTYKMYYCGYVLLPVQTVFQNVCAALAALRLGLPEYVRRVLCGLRGGEESCTGHTSEALPVFSRRAADYISLYMAEPLTVPKIAGFLGISTGYLSHRFREETGFTVTQYIAKIRCAKAAWLLLSSDCPIQDVCQNVGYLDNNYFVKVFRAQFGCTPTEFRRSKTLLQ